MNRVDKLKEELADKNRARGSSPLEIWVKKWLENCGIYDYLTEYQVHPYFIDIAWPEINFGIELDGIQFHQDKARDEKRDAYLKNQGWEIMRIPSTECWNPKKLAIHLKKIFFKIYPKRTITWGLAELFGTTENLRNYPKDIDDWYDPVLERENKLFKQPLWIHYKIKAILQPLDTTSGCLLSYMKGREV